MSHGQENIHPNVPTDVDDADDYEQFELTLIAIHAAKSLAQALQALEEAKGALEEANKRLQPMSYAEYKTRVERRELLENMPRSPTFRTRSKSLPHLGY